MEKTKLIQARLRRGLSCKEMADLIHIEEYSYRRRENGKTKISNKEWEKLASILNVTFDAIFESDYSMIDNNNNGNIKSNSNTCKIESYVIPKEMIENQQEYINLLKSEIELLKNENVLLKMQLKSNQMINV